MSRGNTLWSTLGLLALVTMTLAGCRRDIEAESRAEREANATKITADSTDDATEPIVNEDFRFRLKLPGSGWKLLREHDARSLSADAIAGAMKASDGTCGILIIERMPGATLEQAVALLWQQPLPGLVVESEQDLEFQGVAAKRRVFTASVEGQVFHYVTTAFLHQDHLYQLVSWSLESLELQSRLAFHESFELLDGEVQGKGSSVEPVTHADGVGWRIREGRYESALSGLRLSLPEGWRFIIGAELEKLRSDAEIIATHEGSNVFVGFSVERTDKSRLEGLANMTRSNFMAGQPPVGEPFTREIAGQPVEFRHYHMTPLEFAGGVYLGDDAIASVVAWYPQALREGALAQIDTVLAGIERIPASERAALHEQLLRAPNSQGRFATNRAFRAGEFVDFEYQLRWTVPPGFWSVQPFDKALAHSPQAVLLAGELERGVYTAIEVLDGETNDPADLIAAMTEGDELVSRDTVVENGLTIHRAKFIDSTQTQPFHYTIALTRRDQHIISMMAWSVDDSPKIQAVMDAALAGLDYAPELERTRIVNHKYTDEFFGLSFDIPITFNTPPTIEDFGLGQVSAWTKGNQELVFLAMSGISDDDEWMSSFFEQLLRDVIGNTHPLGKPERSEGQLGAHPARQLTWTVGGTKVQAQIVVREPLLYCMLYANLNDSARATVQTSWTLRE